MACLPGQIIALIEQELGHYKIRERIGAGGMGEVYCAHDSRLDRDVAFKILPVHRPAQDVYDDCRVPIQRVFVNSEAQLKTRLTLREEASSGRALMRKRWPSREAA